MDPHSLLVQTRRKQLRGGPALFAAAFFAGARLAAAFFAGAGAGASGTAVRSALTPPSPAIRALAERPADWNNNRYVAARRHRAGAVPSGHWLVLHHQDGRDQQHGLGEHHGDRTQEQGLAADLRRQQHRQLHHDHRRRRHGQVSNEQRPRPRRFGRGRCCVEGCYAEVRRPRYGGVRRRRGRSQAARSIARSRPSVAGHVDERPGLVDQGFDLPPSAHEDLKFGPHPVGVGAGKVEHLAPYGRHLPGPHLRVGAALLENLVRSGGTGDWVCVGAGARRAPAPTTKAAVTLWGLTTAPGDDQPTLTRRPLA
jgi:hypothetical protein